MLRFLKKFAWTGLLVGAVHCSYGFALLGPNNEAYQVPEIGYNPIPEDALASGPKNLGEEYRRNTPVMYYGYDASFSDFFGEYGKLAVDQAFGIYNSLSNASSYSADLSEVPFSAQRVNFRASALRIEDLKTSTMYIIAETLGLAEPVRYTWTLHDRFLEPGLTCPSGMDYLVIQRNFDPAIGTSLSQFKTSSYVNGVLYSYRIREFCTGPNPLADAVEFPVDQDANPPSAVAERRGLGIGGLFYTGLTRDDVGGLRYLYRTNNMNFESAGPNTVEFVTNTTPQLITSSNLTFLSDAALTNDPAALQALFPGLQIVTSSNYFTYVPVTNIVATFTNDPWAPAGSATLVISTNVTFSFQQLFTYTFGNLFTVQFTTNGPAVVPVTSVSFSTNRVFNTFQTLSASPSPFTPAGSTNVILVTNSTSRTFITNRVSGEFFILPPGLCDVAVVSPIATNVVASTNILVVATNTFGATNVNGQFFTQSIIDYFTNHTFVAFPITCQTPSDALNQGVEKITFIKKEYDSVLGRFFVPVTNEYVLNTVTNNRIVPRRIRRVITGPDFRVSAQDLAAGPAAEPISFDWARVVSFNSTLANPNLAGPGTIESPGVDVPSLIFTKVGPIFDNGVITSGSLSNAFFDESTQITDFVWGSFDGTTNAPIVFPNDVSIQTLENLVLVQVTPAYLPDGNMHSSYNGVLQTTSSGSNWQAPYLWSLAPNSPGLPPGLSLMANGNDGVISGTPTQVGFFDFVIRITDAAGHSTDRSYAIKITP